MINKIINELNKENIVDGFIGNIRYFIKFIGLYLGSVKDICIYLSMLGVVL